MLRYSLLVKRLRGFGSVSKPAWQLNDLEEWKETITKRGLPDKATALVMYNDVELVFKKMANVGAGYRKQLAELYHQNQETKL